MEVLWRGAISTSRESLTSSDGVKFHGIECKEGCDSSCEHDAGSLAARLTILTFIGVLMTPAVGLDQQRSSTVAPGEQFQGGTCRRINSSSSPRWEYGASTQFGCVFPVIRREILRSASRSKNRMVFLAVAPSR
jgi:hypothetical protein